MLEARGKKKNSWRQAASPTRDPGCLSTESVEGLSLALEGVDNVHGSHSLAAGVLGVGDAITDDVLEEDLQHSTSLLVDESRDTLDTSTTSQTANGGLGDTLDIVTEHLSVTLGSTLSKSLWQKKMSVMGEFMVDGKRGGISKRRSSLVPFLLFLGQT